MLLSWNSLPFWPWTTTFPHNTTVIMTTCLKCYASHVSPLIEISPALYFPMQDTGKVHKTENEYVVHLHFISAKMLMNQLQTWQFWTIAVGRFPFSITSVDMIVLKIMYLTTSVRIYFVQFVGVTSEAWNNKYSIQLLQWCFTCDSDWKCSVVETVLWRWCVCSELSIMSPQPAQEALDQTASLSSL